MDVFGRAMQSGGFLCDAAVAAGYELGVFAALAERARSLDELADVTGVGSGPRLRALLDVLAAIGAVGRSGPRFVERVVPPCPDVPQAGWGRLAEVIRRDRPLPATGDAEGGAAAGDGERRFHHHLAQAGAAAAAELIALVGAMSSLTSLLDLGAGAGAYSQAFLAARPDATATLIDTPAVLVLAADWLGPLAVRARFVAGDAGAVDAGDGHGVVLLANLLHLHPPAMCAQLVQAAARAVAPGGVVVIKDLRLDEDRGGPLDGLLFALNMAVYTEAGDVYPTSQLRAWLSDAGLGDIVEHRLAAAPDAVVLIARRPGDAAAAAGRMEVEAIAAELEAALARTAGDAWRQLVESGAIREPAAAGPPVLAFPAAMRQLLAEAVACERRDGAAGDAAAGARAEQLVRHYTEAMPRMRVAQLAGTAEPGATLFHAPLAWDRLPRLGAAIERLFGVLAEAGVEAEPAMGARSAAEFCARSTSLAALYERTHYGGFMPLLYGFPADLAYFAARGVEHGRDALGTIDRYLTAPIIHELCHFARDRQALAPPHLDECLAGWLGVYVHPELAYPVGAHDDALYAAPWLAQVGQAVARAFGVGAVVRAQAGVRAALPAAFVDAAARFGAADWRARRTLHFLSDTFDPAPWIALAVAGGVPEDPAFDRAIVEDGLRAMCLVTEQVDGSFRTRTRLPASPITIDPGGIVAAGRGALDPVVPRYWLPPAVTARIGAGYVLTLRSIAAIPRAAAAICEAVPGQESADWSLARRGPG